jgi:hypothetical protein
MKTDFGLVDDADQKNKGRLSRPKVDATGRIPIPSKRKHSTAGPSVKKQKTLPKDESAVVILDDF